MERNDAFLDKAISAFLSDTDYCVCDLEGPIYSGAARHDKVAIRSKPGIKHFLEKINGNVLFLGNNHILDYDDAGLQETLSFAKENGLISFGAGNNIDEASAPVYLDGECGMLALRYNNKHARATAEQNGCLIWDEDEIIQKRIAEIKENSRWCVLVIHGGDEFCMTPFPEIRKRYHRFLDWGADAIVAHHPHVIQNYENVNGKMIFYSLGNFVFDDNYMRVFPESKNGVLLKLDLQQTGYTWEYMPFVIDGTVPEIKKSEPHAAFNEILDEADYVAKTKTAMRDFLVKERMNLKYQRTRKDIKLKARVRIILSHIKRYIKLQKKVKAFCRSH